MSNRVIDKRVARDYKRPVLVVERKKIQLITIADWVDYYVLNYGEQSAPVKYLRSQAIKHQDGLATKTDPDQEEEIHSYLKQLAIRESNNVG